MGDYVCDKRLVKKEKVAKVIVSKLTKGDINKASALGIMSNMAKRLEDYYDDTEITNKQFEKMLNSLFSKEQLCMELDELLD